MSLVQAFKVSDEEQVRVRNAISGLTLMWLSMGHTLSRFVSCSTLSDRSRFKRYASSEQLKAF